MRYTYKVRELTPHTEESVDVGEAKQMEAMSLKKLRSDINPKCACKGGFCYKWEGNEIVKACKTKER